MLHSNDALQLIFERFSEGLLLATLMFIHMFNGRVVVIPLFIVQLFGSNTFIRILDSC